MKILLTILIWLVASCGWCAVTIDSSDDVIFVSHHASLDITGDLTLSAWINTADSLGFIYVSFKAGSPWNGFGVSIGNATSDKMSFWSDGHGSWVGGNTAITNNTWTHVAIVLDSTTARFYHNGSADGTPTSAAPSSYTSGSRSIGAGLDYTGQLAGQITDVALWDTALSADQISLLASSRGKRLPLQIESSNLKGYWPLDDCPDSSSGDGVTFNDLSSNTNNGTGDDGANNTGLTCTAETYLSYP